MKKCPILKKKCVQHDCEFYIHTVGVHPQTGANIDEWGCAIAYLPLLMIENAYRTRQVSAALDRNNNTFFNALPDHVQQRVAQKSPNLLTNGDEPNV